MNKLVKIDPKEFGLNEIEANKIQAGLSTILEERNVLIDSYKDVIDLEITEETIPTFKSLRLMISKNRTQGLKVWHKTNKAYFLAGGNFVQAIYNKEVAENERMESALMEAEKHFENLEIERIAKLAEERTIKLSAYEPDMIIPNLGEMEESVWNNFISGIKLSFEQRKAEEEKAEKERLRLIEVEKEEARLKLIEDERIRKENERLKKEAEAKEKALTEERARIEAERKADEEKQAAILAKQREDAEIKLKAQQEIARIEAEKAAEERARIEAELKAKEDAEIAERKAKEKELAEQKIADQKEAQAPDKDKLIKSINEMIFIDGEFKTAEAQVVYNVVNQKFEAFKKWAIQQTSSL